MTQNMYSEGGKYSCWTFLQTHQKLTIDSLSSFFLNLPLVALLCNVARCSQINRTIFTWRSIPKYLNASRHFKWFMDHLGNLEILNHSDIILNLWGGHEYMSSLYLISPNSRWCCVGPQGNSPYSEYCLKLSAQQPTLEMFASSGK